MAGRQIVVDILGDATKFTRATQQATTSAGKFSNVLKGVGMGLGIGFTNMAAQASQAVVQFGVDSVKAASNQREAFALTEQVFGHNAAALGEWADAKDDAFSTTEALTFASQFGTAFKNVGMSMDETTDKAKEMTKLAGDLGSAFNTSSAEAATALRSGLLGESEPMRKFGVFLDEAKVKAKGAAMGMEILGGKMTDGQKVAARYALIMEQTADSQGMFGRDTGSLADKSKLLENNIADLQAEIGGPLVRSLATGTDTMLAFMKAMDLDQPQDLTDRLKGLGDMVDTINPLMWANNVAWGQWATTTEEAAEKAKEALGRTAADWAEQSARMQSAYGALGDTSEETTDDIIGDNKATRKSYRELAADLLESFVDKYDRAMDIVEARADRHAAKTDEDKAEAMMRLAELGALSAAGYEELLGTMRRMAKGMKGEAHRAIMDAIHDIEMLRGIASRPITVKVEYRSAGSSPLRPVKRRASGGETSGLTWVGEEGPELIDAPRGTMVTSAARSKQMASRSGVTVNVHGNIYGPSGVDELMDMMAQRLRLDGV